MKPLWKSELSRDDQVQDISLTLKKVKFWEFTGWSAPAVLSSST